ncbi:MAG: TAXI family TRAP transporter solute-binding subunit [Dehalococcoidia bacterium]|nr:TAXI family TRAP transporter solute-binding subunit [Dehalococcoidia bacterium]
MKKLIIVLSVLLSIGVVLAGCSKGSSSTTTTTKPATTQSTTQAATTTAKPTTTIAASTSVAPTTTTTTTVPKPTTTALKPLPSIINMPYRTGAVTGQVTLGLAATIAQNLGVKVALQEVSADLAMFTAMAAKQGDFALAGSTTVFNANAGIGDFLTTGPQQTRMIFKGPPQYVVLYTSGKTGIHTFADLKGKRLAYIPASAVVNETTGLMLNAMGLTWDDVKKVNVDSAAASIEALKAGVLDVPVVATYPGDQFVELAATIGLVILPFTPAPAAEKTFASLRPTNPLANVTKGQFTGVEQDMKLPTSANYVICYSYIDDDLAYQFTRANYAVVENTPVAKDKGYVKAGAVSLPFVAPYHPGAVRFYKEIGMWTAAFENLQQQLLADEKVKVDAWKAKPK